MKAAAAHIRAAVLAAAACGLGAAPATAGMQVSCAEPRIFPQASVNLVVIPYALGGVDRHYRLRPDLGALAASEAAGSLASLIQLDTLYSLDYPVGMAVVHLIPTGEPCGPSDVLPALVAQMEEGNGLALLWGSFIEEAGQIYVQSYLRFFRKGRDGAIEIGLAPFDRPLRLTGRLAQQGLGFAPRVLTTDDLGRITQAGVRARRIWSAPQGGHVVGQLPLAVTEPYAYRVTDIDQNAGRMRIRPLPGHGRGDADGGWAEGDWAEGGWIEARPIWPLRETLPELHFVNGVMGYLGARVLAGIEARAGTDGPSRRFLRISRRASAAFARYREALADDLESGRNIDARTSVALSWMLDGMLALVTRTASASQTQGARADYRRALNAFRQAARLAPYRADARNFVAIAHCGLAAAPLGIGTAMQPSGYAAIEAGLAVQAWRATLSLDPGNAPVAHNLGAAYRLLLETGLSEMIGLAPEDVRTRLRTLPTGAPRDDDGDGEQTGPDRRTRRLPPEQGREHEAQLPRRKPVRLPERVPERVPEQQSYPPAQERQPTFRQIAPSGNIAYPPAQRTLPLPEPEPRRAE